ncbi:hypothetical protein C8R46DRAFT_342125 [Mycena filopes]|nr:hypothetical protein C8R46DRAFT_342125 [Mycena filopes]
MFSRCRFKLKPGLLPNNAPGRRFKHKRTPQEPKIIDVDKLPAKSPERALEPWQKDAIQACMVAIDSGRTKIGMHTYGDRYHTLLLPLLDRIRPNPHAIPNAPQVLVVAEDPSLDKLALRIAQQRVDWKVETDAKTVSEPSKADVLVTTYKRLMRDSARFKNRINISALKAVVLSGVETCTPPFGPNFDTFWSRLFDPPDSSADAPVKGHRAPKPSRSPVVIAFTVKDNFNLIRRLGNIEEVVYRRTPLDALDTQECDSRFMAVALPLGLRKLSFKHGKDFAAPVLSKVMRRPAILRATLNAWLNNAATRESTVLYCVNEPHAKELVKLFQGAKVDARWLEDPDVKTKKGKQKSNLRSAYDKGLASFSAGEFPVLILTHSRTLHVPRIDCLLLAAPTADYSVYGSRLSSAMSASPDTGKEDSLIIEMVDAARLKRMRVYDVGDLLQLPPEEIQGQPLATLRTRAQVLANGALKQDLRALEKEREERATAPPTEPTVISVQHTSALAKQDSAEKADQALQIANKFHKGRTWVRCAPGIYVHDCYQVGHVIIRTKPNEGGPAHYEALWSPVQLAEGTPSARGPPACSLSVENSMLVNILPHVRQFLGGFTPPHPPEYRTTKASDAQLAALRELYPVDVLTYLTLPDEKPLPRDKLLDFVTKGEASNALARLRYTQGQAGDLTPFTHAELVKIAKRIQNNVQLKPASVRLSWGPEAKRWRRETKEALKKNQAKRRRAG